MTYALASAAIVPLPQETRTGGHTALRCDDTGILSDECRDTAPLTAGVRNYAGESGATCGRYVDDRMEGPGWRGSYVLRRHDPRQTSAQSVLSELTWMEALSRDPSIPVPIPVRQPNGSLDPVIGIEGDESLWTVLHWVDGASRHCTRLPARGLPRHTSRAPFTTVTTFGGLQTGFGYMRTHSLAVVRPQLYTSHCKRAQLSSIVSTRCLANADSSTPTFTMAISSSSNRRIEPA